MCIYNIHIFVWCTVFTYVYNTQEMGSGSVSLTLFTSYTVYVYIYNKYEHTPMSTYRVMYVYVYN